MEKIIEYYGVKIDLCGYHYKNDPALKPSYKKGTSHKELYLEHATKNKRFKTREEMDKFLRECGR